MRTITPFLWFDNNAEEAIHFYMSIFKNAKILSMTRSGEPGPGGKEKLMNATFQLEGREFMALNGGPQFKFNEAISLFVNCDTQQDVDDLWSRLTDGGEEGQCGWLKDKFGVSWQVIPSALGEMLGDPDPAKAQRALHAMLQMTKIDIAKLRAARDAS